ncbi:MAG: GNAT family N-acetyltransferase [Candidatus Eremiobacteraeota bacterium]|nr:GNAT family N-acetyltransferase [Candidatus Eremiobacteraeota bacterium]
MNVRRIERRDAQAWLKMQLELWPDAERAEQVASIEEYFRGTSIFTTVAFLAESDREPIGFLEINLRAYAEGAESSPVPHIEGWFVTPQFRRTGAGRALMRAAEEWARSQGYRELTSDTTDDYPLSLAAHKNLGFTEVERLIALRKSLDAID